VQPHAYPSENLYHIYIASVCICVLAPFLPDLLPSLTGKCYLVPHAVSINSNELVHHNQHVCPYRFSYNCSATMRMFTILVRHAIHLSVGTKYSLCCAYVAHSYSLMVTPLPSIHVVTCLAFCQVFMAGIFQIADWVSTLCFGSRLLLQHIHFNIQHYMVSTPRRICLCCLAWGNSFIIQGNYSHGTENDVGVTCRAI